LKSLRCDFEEVSIPNQVRSTVIIRNDHRVLEVLFASKRFGFVTVLFLTGVSKNEER